MLWLLASLMCTGSKLQVLGLALPTMTLLLASCRGFSIGDFAFGSMERLIEAITAMDQQEERPTEQAFLDALPRVLVTRRTSCDFADDPSAKPQTSADAGEGPTEGLPDPGPDSQGAAKELASSKHAVVGEQCTICHEAYGHNHEVVELPCNHSFHEDCILPWLKSHHTCPVRHHRLLLLYLLLLLGVQGSNLLVILIH